MYSFELAEKVQSDHGITVRHMRRSKLRKELDSFAEVYNSAWSENWDFVPFSKKDLDAMLVLAQKGIRELFAVQKKALGAVRF